MREDVKKADVKLVLYKEWKITGHSCSKKLGTKFGRPLRRRVGRCRVDCRVHIETQDRVVQDRRMIAQVRAAQGRKGVQRILRRNLSSFAVP